MLLITNTTETAFTFSGIPLPIGQKIYLFIENFNSNLGVMNINAFPNKQIIEIVDGVEVIKYEPIPKIDQLQSVGIEITGNQELSKNGLKGIGLREDTIYEASLLAVNYFETTVPTTLNGFFIVGLNLEPII
jgi:hypothetical protein